jgi:hypothetical protein
MTTTYDAMRIFAGMNFLRREITTFEQISTAMTDTPMPTPFLREVVVASDGHVPKT